MRKRLLPLALILLLALPLVLLLRDFARDVLVVELFRFYWGARILFESLPQLPLWGLLLVTVVVIALRSLRRGKRREAPHPGREPEPAGQVRTLARWIERAAEGEYFRWSLAQHLGGLAWDVMAYREQTTLAVLKARLQAGRLDLPPVVEAYLRAQQTRHFAPTSGILGALRARLQPAPPASAPDPELARVVEFLQDQLSRDQN